MGHWNTQFNDHVNDSVSDPQGYSHLHSEPCIFYGSVANYPQPSIHSVASTLENRRNLNFHLIPEHHDSALFYGMPHYNSVRPQHSTSNLDLAITAPSSHFNPYLAPPSGIREFPVPVNHGAYDQLPLSSSQRDGGVPADGYFRNIPYVDGVRASFKRNIVDGVPTNHQYHNASAGPSSSIAAPSAQPAESDVTSMDAASFLPPEYGGSEPASMVENRSHRIVRNRPGLIRPDSALAHNTGHLLRNYVASPVQIHGNPWLDMQFGANNSDIGTFPWTQTPDSPYVRAGVNGACVDTGNIGIQGYQVAGSNIISNGFLNPPIPQGHPNPYHPTPPLQAVRGYNVNFPSLVATSSRRISTIRASNSSINPYRGVIDAGPAFLVPGLPTGFQLYQPHQRDITLNSNARHHNLPHLRVLPEDEVAVLDIPGYHEDEAGGSVDQHIDMRLDIDHMSYEELLALGEQIGSVGTGLPKEFIRNNLKTRTFTCSASCINLEEAASLDEQINFCVVCQTDFKNGETIGTLDCGHEYHSICIEKWLPVKNTCPVCKSTALSCKPKGS
ncbi:probable E3 ubiquitin-protein ligase ZFP1 [Primulina huaijiensis]|uniref:probable E3 ubiquitin-protein ligase ZFP1 n=1 Tax=Primulina huaijiensis TaxID=1492673 RepID=UPI003CC7184E